METFFFISLGITFILILLLVYHFKQRLSNLEQKSDTMLDIVNNVVKEMGVIKVLASSRPAHPLSAFMDNQRPLNDTFSKMSMNNIEVNEVNINEKDVSDVQEIHLAEPVEMDSEDEEEDSDDEAEYSDDEEEDAEEEHDQDDEKVVVSDDEEDEQAEEEEMEQEKETVEEEVKVIQEVEEVLEEQSIVVNKLEAEEVEVLSEGSSEDPMEEYKKLAPAALKALIISKGYATDVAKMKKPQLLQILEENL
jgi:hypothetical protein